MTSACAEQANSKMQKTGAEGAVNGPSLLPASDLERWAVCSEARAHYSDLLVCSQAQH
jgi:hypothetical protein